MNTKYSKTLLSKMMKEHATETKEWFQAVRQMKISDNAKLMFFIREALQLCDDIITMSNYVKRKIK